MTVQTDLFGANEFVEDQDQAETLDDIDDVDLRTVSQAVVSATDWTTETVINQINKGNIQLNPRFQRRDAWEPDRKSRFIESLILGLPIPQLVLAEAKNKRGSYIVIDGKQRLLSIRQFAADQNDPLFRRLRLTGISIRHDLRRMSLLDLRNDPALSEDLAAFENQPIRTVVIKNWESEDFLYQVFLRLNTGSVPLSPQELRQALHPGAFVEFADVASGESPALRDLLKLKRPDFRMRDAELLIRWYAFQMFAPAYSGDLKRFLDETCQSLNGSWTEFEPQIQFSLSQFEAAYLVAKQIFAENTFRKWTGRAYERPFNRAIFDIMLYYFSREEVRSAALERRAEIESAFKNLCEANPEFLGSIERTTKSIGATSSRFSIWATALNGVLGTSLKSPFLAA